MYVLILAALDESRKVNSNEKRYDIGKSIKIVLAICVKRQLWISDIFAH